MKLTTTSSMPKTSIKAILTYVCIPAVCFLLGISLSGLFINWISYHESFFQFRLIEIIRIMATVAVAIYIAWIINSKVNDTAKKKELFSNLLSRFQDQLGELMEFITKNRDPDGANNGTVILAKFKRLGELIGIIITSQETNNKIFQLDGSLNTLFIEFKVSATDDPFPINTEYTTAQIRTIEAKYASLINKISAINFKIYS